MSTSRQLLEEAGQTLSRAGAVIARAAEDLGPPFSEALEFHAAAVQRVRRRLRTALTTITAGRVG